MMLLIIMIAATGTLLIISYLMRHAVKQAENPTPVLENEDYTFPIKIVRKTLSRWKKEGRITREQQEDLLTLCREDISTPIPEKTEHTAEPTIPQSL